MTECHYRHHGLALLSNEPLPGLTPAAPAPPDVSIAMLPVGHAPRAELGWVMPAPPRQIWRAPTAGGTLVRARYDSDAEWAEFVIDESGRELSAGRSENVPLAEAAELMLGPVFSLLLAQRGITCLHASVIEVEHRTVAIIGATGAGKSTTAQALVERGAALISDDVAVLRGRTILNGDGTQDRALDLLCLLCAPGHTGVEPALRRLRAADALPRLMANRHMVEVFERDSHTRDFERLARLAETVPAVELIRPWDLDKLPGIAAVLAAGARRLR